MAQMRADMDAMAASIATIRSELPEYHAMVHEAQSAFQRRTTERLQALEDIMSLEQEPRPKQKNQGDILRALLAANNGMYASAKDVRRKMGLNEVQFSQLLKVSKGFVEVKENPRDRRQKLLKIK